MKNITFLLIFMSFCAVAEQKYNPHTNKFETVRPNSQLKYNYMQEEWKYVQPNSRIEYNPLTDRYDMAPKEYVNKYNYMEGQWEKTHPNSQLKINPTNGEFQYVAPNEKLEFINRQGAVLRKAKSWRSMTEAMKKQYSKYLDYKADE